MKERNEKKVPLPLKVPEYLLEEIDAEAKVKSLTRSEVALYRLQHYPIPLTPELMSELSNNANMRYEELKAEQPEEAIKIQKEVMALWNRLK